MSVGGEKFSQAGAQVFLRGGVLGSVDEIVALAGVGFEVVKFVRAVGEAGD